jgi:hypothetical protein
VLICVCVRGGGIRGVQKTSCQKLSVHGVCKPISVVFERDRRQRMPVCGLSSLRVPVRSNVKQPN